MSFLKIHTLRFGCAGLWAQFASASGAACEAILGACQSRLLCSNSFFKHIPSPSCLSYHPTRRRTSPSSCGKHRHLYRRHQLVPNHCRTDRRPKQQISILSQRSTADWAYLTVLAIWDLYKVNLYWYICSTRKDEAGGCCSAWRDSRGVWFAFDTLVADD